MADSTGKNESISEIVPWQLGKYLRDKVGGLKEFYDEFPNASQKFKMPSVSVISTRSDFKPTGVPYKTKPIENVDITDHKAPVLYVVGDYEITIQLDIWAGSKEERDDLFDATFNALNPNISPMGLDLVLAEYFGCRCNYLYVGHAFDDSEISSQKDEWRATLNIIATCKAIRDRKEFVMETFDLDVQVSENPIDD